MTETTERDDQSHDDAIDSLADPETLRQRAGVDVTQHTVEHEDPDHCSIDIAGASLPA